jgi:hypothetical protein
MNSDSNLSYIYAINLLYSYFYEILYTYIVVSKTDRTQAEHVS